jgi:hypothetical protein
MSNVVFHRTARKLQLFSDGVATPVAEFEADNNVDSHSRGEWPNGIYSYSHWTPHPGDDANSMFGQHGIFLFDVAGREGMGIHAGRQLVKDGLGRMGPAHCTLGCIRTTDEGTEAMLRLHAQQPITQLMVLA